MGRGPVLTSFLYVMCGRAMALVLLCCRSSEYKELEIVVLRHEVAFDTVFPADGVRVIRTPVRAPKANAVAERFVGSVRRECLDWLLIANRRHPNRVLREFAEHYNSHRPHRALGLAPPNPARQHDPSRPRQPARYADATGSAASSTTTPSPPKTVPRSKLRTPRAPGHRALAGDPRRAPPLRREDGVSGHFVGEGAV
jgi:hypothetical protein